VAQRGSVPGAKETPSDGEPILAIRGGRVSLCLVLHGGELLGRWDADSGMDRRSRRPLDGPRSDVVPVVSSGKWNLGRTWPELSCRRRGAPHGGLKKGKAVRARTRGRRLGRCAPVGQRSW
jgi:hypothetical protein